MATPFPFVVEELTGPAREVTLRGRSLPYRKVTWESEQRLNINWFVGNPVASTQVLGRKLLPTTITGIWKDRFLFDDSNAAVLRNFPPLSVGALPGTNVIGGPSFASAGSIPTAAAFRARVLRDAFQAINDAGQLVRVEWGSLARFGFLQHVKWIHDREEDIEYSMTFEWIGVTPVQPRLAFKPKLDVLGFLSKLLAALNRILDLLLKLNAFISGQLSRIFAVITSIQAFITLMSEALQSLVSFALAPFEILQSLKGILTSLKLACFDLMIECSIIAGAYGTDQPGTFTNIVDKIDLSIFTKLMRKYTQELGAEAQEQIEQIDAVLVSDIIAVVNMPARMTLRDISLRFYGTADRWRELAQRNGLTTSKPPQGALILVPR